MDFLKIVDDAVVKQNSTMLEEGVREIAVFCFKDSSSGDAFPDVAFEKIIELMDQEAFLKMEGSHNLLLIFEYDWGRLSDEQKKILLENLKNLYDKFSEWMSYFVISELLGEYYCNEDSLEVLSHLKVTNNNAARALVPHGFEHIVRESHDASLRDKALLQLKSMENDEFPQVREEVAESLANISDNMLPRSE